MYSVEEKNLFCSMLQYYCTFDSSLLEILQTFYVFGALPDPAVRGYFAFENCRLALSV